MNVDDKKQYFSYKFLVGNFCADKQISGFTG